jgi:hypothetical protein
MERPSRSALSRSWLAHLDAMHDALAAAPSQDVPGLRFEITIAKNELMRRGLPAGAFDPPGRTGGVADAPCEVSAWPHPRGAGAVRRGADEDRPELQRPGHDQAGLGAPAQGAGSGPPAGATRETLIDARRRVGPASRAASTVAGA